MAELIKLGFNLAFNCRTGQSSLQLLFHHLPRLSELRIICPEFFHPRRRFLFLLYGNIQTDSTVLRITLFFSRTGRQTLSAGNFRRPASAHLWQPVIFRRKTGNIPRTYIRKPGSAAGVIVP